MPLLKRGIILLFGCLMSASVIAQKNSKDVLDLLGKPYNAEEILELIMPHDPTKNRELLNPVSNTYLLEVPEGGFSMEFDINFSLRAIRLYAKGYTYQQCPLKAPYGVELGMHIDTIHNNNLLFKYEDYSKFKLFGSFETSDIELYFKDDHLEMIRVTANQAFLDRANIENAKSWKFRLIPDGICVSGGCTNDSGYMKWGDGVLEYKGQWKYGFPHGEGMYKDKYGNQYRGQFKLGFVWGKGQFIRTGEEYFGDMVMGEKSGFGIAKYQNGSSYEGNWLKDTVHGKGRLEIANSYYYEGIFKKGIYHGQGKLGSKEGYYEGSFALGKPHGKGVQFAFDSQKKLEGTWLNGKKNGLFTLTSPFTDTQKIRFKNDVEVPLEDP